MKVLIRDYDTPKDERVRVEIEPFDLWDMDVTLAEIILPMLKQFAETSQGFVIVDQEDLPEDLRISNSNDDHQQLDMFFTSAHEDEVWKVQANQWNWVLHRMISSFELVLNGFGQFPDEYMHCREGLRLFGKYYTGLWD